MILETVLTSAPDWLRAHAAVLVVVFPLVAAPLLCMLPGGRLPWVLTILTTALSFLCALVVLATIQSSPVGVISYPLGNWPPPIGIEFRLDALNSIVLLIVTGTGLLASIFGWSTISAELRSEKLGMFFGTFLLCFSGLLGVTATADAFNLFVFLEISSLATYALVAMGAKRDRRALPAAFNYLIMGTLGASFFVIGVGFLYAATGTLNMADMATQLPALTGNRAVQVGFGFIVVGLGLKAAMWPLHQWLPGAYSYSPSFVTMFLSATATKVALYALIRFLFTVFQPDYAFEQASFVWIFAPLGIAAMLICSFQACFQTDVRRILAYSSVAQVGYMILGVSLATASGVAAGLLHMFNHALMKGALFMAVAGICLTYSRSHIRDFAGAGRSAPWTMTAFAIAGLSLIGVPLTAGFISKVQLGSALFESGWWWAVLLMVFSSFLAVFYIGRILQAVFFMPPADPRKLPKEAPVLLLVPLWILALANIYFGVAADFPVSLAREGAVAALGVEAFR
ncbi:monovalent cation/H+ antiporter subunit D family protein [Hyphomonas sp.]|uniref:monovalent cation/H+ antiporter subunit D family protein n=1 Tax=Hyphomonas sp. TaxID=87 RepID=UPI00391A95AB